MYNMVCKYNEYENRLVTYCTETLMKYGNLLK